MTRRQDIVDAIKGNPLSIKSIAQKLRIDIKVVKEDLKHIQRSVGKKNLIIEPAHCKKCGFVFEKAEVKRPSKCPKCKSEWLEQALFSIK